VDSASTIDVAFLPFSMIASFLNLRHTQMKKKN